MKRFFWIDTNANAINPVTPDDIAPHSIPLPSGGEGRVRGSLVKKLNAFVLDFIVT